MKLNYGKNIRNAAKTLSRFAAPLLVAGLLKIAPAYAMESRLPGLEPLRKQGVYGLITKCKPKKKCEFTVRKGDIIVGIGKTQLINGKVVHTQIEMKVVGLDRKGITIFGESYMGGMISRKQFRFGFGKDTIKHFSMSFSNGQFLTLLGRFDVVPTKDPAVAKVTARR
jgi:hypothetical protein